MTGHTFLILDDDADARRILEDVLLKAFPRSEIFDTDSAKEARDLCAAFVIDCMLVKSSMPLIGGFAEKVRGAHPHLPIVFFTGVDGEMLIGQQQTRMNAETIARVIERAIDSCAHAESSGRQVG